MVLYTPAFQPAIKKLRTTTNAVTVIFSLWNPAAWLPLPHNYCFKRYNDHGKLYCQQHFCEYKDKIYLASNLAACRKETSCFVELILQKLAQSFIILIILWLCFGHVILTTRYVFSCSMCRRDKKMMHPPHNKLTLVGYLLISARITNVAHFLCNFMYINMLYLSKTIYLNFLTFRV